METLLQGLAVVAALAIFLGMYFAPAIVAYRRKHEYRHVIFGINAFAGFTGIGWLVAIVWAAWPSEKSLADPFLGNVTGKGFRKTAHSFSEFPIDLREGSELAEAAYQERKRNRQQQPPPLQHR